MSSEWAGDGPGCHEAPSPARSSGRWMQIWGHRPLLLAVARRHAGCTEDGEDAVHEAMLRAAERPEIGDDRLLPWLITVTRRLCADGHRRRAREARRWVRMSAQARVADPEQRPEEEACRRAEAAWAAARAAGLPRRQAEALQLTAAGCDVGQVAASLGVSYRTAESLLARARRTMRAGLAVGVGFLAWAGRVCCGPAGGPVPATVAFVAAAAAALAPVALTPDVSPHTDRPPPPVVARTTAVEVPVTAVPGTAEGLGGQPVRAPAPRTSTHGGQPKPAEPSGPPMSVRPAPSRGSEPAVAVPELPPPPAVTPPRAPAVPPPEDVRRATRTDVTVSGDTPEPRVAAPAAPTTVPDPAEQELSTTPIG